MLVTIINQGIKVPKSINIDNNREIKRHFTLTIYCSWIKTYRLPEEDQRHRLVLPKLSEQIAMLCDGNQLIMMTYMVPTNRSNWQAIIGNFLIVLIR